MTPNERGPEEELWQEVLNNDKEAFEKLAAPYLDDLLKAARHDIAYYEHSGLLQPQDLTPEELVGETLLRTWDNRYQRPPGVSMRGWLLGMQYRALRRLTARDERYRHEKAISLDEQLPTSEVDTDAVQEDFWEWYQPDDYQTWEEVIPADMPVDIEIDISSHDRGYDLDPKGRHILFLHDEFRLPIVEVAYIMNTTVRDTAARLQQARVSVNQELRDTEGD